jgi:hypothetical protein
MYPSGKTITEVSSYRTRFYRAHFQSREPAHARLCASLARMCIWWWMGFRTSNKIDADYGGVKQGAIIHAGLGFSLLLSLWELKTINQSIKKAFYEVIELKNPKESPRCTVFWNIYCTKRQTPFLKTYGMLTSQPEEHCWGSVYSFHITHLPAKPVLSPSG